MARSAIPDPLKRRHLVESPLDPARARRIAEAYLAENRRLEAIDFLRKAGDTERLATLRQEAADEGHVFLLRAVCAAAGDPPDAALWEHTARAAARAGRELDALEAERQVARLRS